MNRKRLMSVLAVLAIVGSAASANPGGSQVVLDAALSHPYMQAGKTDTTYLRVGLTGFEMDKTDRRAAVNIAVVIDKSGSMAGEKIEKAREAAIQAIRRLDSRDIVSVVVYDSNVRVLVPATKAKDIDRIVEKIRSVQAGGSTALHGGVARGAEEVRKFTENGLVNRIVLLSDGLANVGPQSPEQLGQLGAELGSEGISVTTIGLGLGYNEDLMSKLAFHSDGRHYFVEKAAQLAEVFDKEFGNAMSVVAQEARVQIRCAKGIRPVRLLAREGTIDGQTVTVDINQIYSLNEKYFLLEIETPAERDDAMRRVGTVTVTYHNLKTHTNDKLTSELQVHFTSSKELVEKRTNKEVMADVVEQLANERNELAVRLRDQGKVAEAQQTLLDNAAYLHQNAYRYGSDELKQMAAENEVDAQNVEREEEWGRQRKDMRGRQAASRGQYRSK